MKNTHQLAQINIGRMQGNRIEDPVMQEFVNNLDRINALAEQSPGFVWRLKDESNNATHFSPYEDDRIIINISVWEDVQSLKQFTYQTIHTNYLKRRRAWFEKFEKPFTALWWIPSGQFPTIGQAVDRLHFYQEQGPSKKAFDFNVHFPPSAPS